MGEEPLTSETDLIARARGGDAAAFCALAARYERRVYSLALHFCRDRADAEDLSQEVWLRAFRALASFRGDSSFYTWLRSIAVNAFLNSRESARRRGGVIPCPRRKFFPRGRANRTGRRAVYCVGREPGWRRKT